MKVFKIKILYFTCMVFCLATGNFCKANPKDTLMGTNDIYTANRLLAKTINIGYAITWDKPGRPVTPNDLIRIKQAGFTAVRLPVNWVSAMDAAAPYKLNDSFLGEIDHLIGIALKNNLAIVLNNHTDEQLMNDPEQFKERYFSLWQQLAVHYKDYPPQVMFELLAEPHDKMDARWNEYLKASLAIVRKTNPDRAVIVGPPSFNRSQMLSTLELPQDDRHLIVTVHQYNPIKFTMQGEQWFPIGKPTEWLGTQWPQNGADENDIIQLMDDIAAWAHQNNRPIFMGEFGVSTNADAASASRWIRFNREQAEKHRFSWGYWSCYAVSFSIFNEQSNNWKSEYLNALIPGSAPATATNLPDTSIRKVKSGLSAGTVLKKCLDAMGGVKLIDEIQQVSLSGTAMMGDQLLNLEEDYTFPDHYEETITLNGITFLDTFVKPDTMSVAAQGRNIELKPGDKESLFEKSNLFLERYLLSNKNYKLNLMGIQLANGEDCYVVKITSPLNRTFFNYYSVKTNLRVETAYIEKTATGNVNCQTLYQNYQPVQGVLIATRVINDKGSFRITGNFSKVSVVKK